MEIKIAIKNKAKARKYFAVHNAQPGRRIMQGKKVGNLLFDFPLNAHSEIRHYVLE